MYKKKEQKKPKKKFPPINAQSAILIWLLVNLTVCSLTKET